MGKETNISWCDATVNFWYGCKKVSEGCKFCYMFRDREKYGQEGTDLKKTSNRTLTKIIKDLHVKRISQEMAGNKKPLSIFTCSWSDFFLEEADPWRKEAWDIIRDNKEFIWIILTKRIERAKDCLPEDWGAGWDNVILGVSAENQERWDQRIPLLVETPAKYRAVSIEPLLSSVDIFKPLPASGIGLVQHIALLDWIIVGGESGNDTGEWRYRPCNEHWIKKIVSGCKDSGKAVFVKQLGTYLAKKFMLKNRAGADMNEWPFDEIKIQERIGYCCQAAQQEH